MNDVMPNSLQPAVNGPTLEQLLDPAMRVGLSSLLLFWRARDPAQWSANIQAYRVLGERVLKLGEPLLAFDIVSEGLKASPADIRLQQLLALSLSRCGAFERANVILKKLRKDGSANEETLGLFASTHKDLALRARESDEREMHLQRADEIYAEAYKLTGGYYSGINAATMALLTGDEERAKTFATKVAEQCRTELERQPGDPYWLLATLGEASLILRDRTQAEDWYKKAVAAAGKRFGDIHSSRRNARLILKYQEADASSVEQVLKVPNVVVFAGHMIDQPSRPVPRFPPKMEASVAAEIRARLEKLGACFGYASAACGSDILFLEAMIERGGEISVMLPYEKEQFVKDSVAFAGAEWSARLEKVLSQATKVDVASNQKLEIGAVSYDYTNQLLFGLANLRARRLETKLLPLAVWDGQKGDGPGGTASVIERWKNARCKVEIIPLSNNTKTLRSTAVPRRKVKAETSLDTEVQFGSRIMAMLFADAVGFSKLTEAQVPLFVKYFLGDIANLMARSPFAPIVKNTWGDGLYFVFPDVRAAGQFALELCDHVRDANWPERGFPKGLGLRIALHAGPVYECNDPITKQRTFVGTHVSRAARIEPITPPGQVYSSEAFAALATIESAPSFTCSYVGQTPLAKGYGTFPTYHVRRI